MDSQVFVEVGLLGEALVTAFLGTDERSLSGVNPQVIEEIVPLAEEHFTVNIVAF